MVSVGAIVEAGQMTLGKVEENKHTERISEYLLECSQNAVGNDLKRRINLLRDEFNRGEHNSILVLSKLAILSNEDPVKEANLVNSIEQFYSTNSTFYNVLKDDKLNSFFLDKDEVYMFTNGWYIDEYVWHCLESSLDPVALANIKINREAIRDYETEMIVDLVSTTYDIIQSTDIQRDFSTVKNYIEQLKHSEFTVSLFGEVNSGKSTILNAIIGMNLAFTYVETCTAVPIVYENDTMQGVPVLLLDNHFNKYGLVDRYEGEEISAVLRKLNEIVREESIKLTTNQWPVVKTRFNGIHNRIRIIDTPGISETSRRLLQYAKQALDRSVCMMVILPCDKINTTSEDAIKAYTDSVINKGKYTCIIANRWDEYEKGLDPHGKIKKKEELKKRFKTKGYGKVFITTGNNAFHTSQIDKILQSGRKPEWREARIWADKCLSNAVTTLEDLEEEYQELSMDQLQKMVTKVSTNSGISELVSYLDTGLNKNIQRETILYVCNNLMKELSVLESLRGPIRDSGIKSISDAEQQLKINSNNKVLLNISIAQWKRHIATGSHKLTEYISHKNKDITISIRDHLYNTFKVIKMTIERSQQKGRKTAAKDSISKGNHNDIIFFRDQESQVQLQIYQLISEVLLLSGRSEIKNINSQLCGTLQELKTELRNSCDNWNIVSFIDQVRIDNYIFNEESMKRIFSITVCRVNVAQPMILQMFGPRERQSKDRLCIKEMDFRVSIDLIIDDLMIKFNDNIRLHLSRHIEDFTSYVENGSNGILDAIEANIHRFRHNKVEEMRRLDVRIRSDLKLNACNKILGKIKHKYLSHGR
ncbi:hypothetical protein K7432_010944 [Basidiobolus ranarum]|uniref:Dynamin N-terminal domain-containing protein n=1 Tax=Basidiobolus ranarum TaxID=34480 RepID=A0ABR2WN24_9FUNG